MSALWIIAIPQRLTILFGPFLPSFCRRFRGFPNRPLNGVCPSISRIPVSAFVLGSEFLFEFLFSSFALRMFLIMFDSFTQISAILKAHFRCVLVFMLPSTNI